MENNELKFAKILEDLKYTARNRGGYVTREEIYSSFDEMDLSENQYELVIEYLKNSKIGIDSPLSEEEALSEESRNILDDYRSELESIEIITDGQKRAYVMAAMNKDTSSYEKLTAYYLPKVLEIAKLYSEQGVLIEDLVGEGNLAVALGVTMLDAIEEPDEADGMIIKLIMDAMEEAISESASSSSQDEKIAEKVNRVSEEAVRLREELGRKVTVEELVNNTSLSKKAVLDAIKLTGNKIEDIDYRND